ncbi:glycosyltransferase family 2 protein, partial [Muricomes intestini]|uniref:glycosyltransferase family 2 protein n=1 Tax=Muricomes intestini TaxID=1796634 RepID=UPI002FE2601E
PLISVVMTVHNSEEYLMESINSVLTQSYANLQIIIVDDGSTDKTPKLLKEISDKRVEIYTLSENRHISYATNYGFSKVRGKYLAIMDSDDIWMKDKLYKQVMYMQKHPEHKGCFTWVDLIDQDGKNVNKELSQLKELFSASTEDQEYWLRFFFFHGNRLNNPSSLIDADTVSEIGGHNLFYIQATDMEWWVRFTKKYTFGIIEEPLIKYRRILNNDKNVSSYSEIHDARFYNEHMHIRYHFFDDMEDELFIRAFKESFLDPGSHTPQELACEKAFLICRPFGQSSSYSAPGMIKIEEMLNNPETALLMKEKYNFSTIECGKYTGNHLYNDPYLQNLQKGYSELKKQNDLCHLHINKLDGEINHQNQEIRQLNTAIVEKGAMLQALTQQSKDLTEKNNDLLNDLNMIKNSTSWRITSPLRKLKNKFKGSHR